MCNVWEVQTWPYMCMSTSKYSYFFTGTPQEINTIIWLQNPENCEYLWCVSQQTMSGSFIVRSRALLLTTFRLVRIWPPVCPPAESSSPSSSPHPLVVHHKTLQGTVWWLAGTPWELHVWMWVCVLQVGGWWCVWWCQSAQNPVVCLLHMLCVLSPYACLFHSGRKHDTAISLLHNHVVDLSCCSAAAVITIQ